MDAEHARAEAVRWARAILAGEADLVPACRAIQRPLDALGLRLDADFSIFVGVDSEADEVPFGDERRLWNPDALRRADAERAAMEAHYRPHVERACRTLIARLG